MIYDLYWTPKNSGHWVWIQEIPFDLAKEEFVWLETKNFTHKTLKNKRWFQNVKYMKKNKNKTCGESE